MGPTPENAMPEDSMRDEYDFSRLGTVVRGKHYRQGRITRLLELEEDVAAAFRDGETLDAAAVNAALREYLRQKGDAKASGKRP